MKKLKQNSAITLIALVITIIVLLILAAVALNIVLGENGIFTKARTSKEKMQYASAKEIVDLKILEINSEVAINGGEFIETADVNIREDGQITIEKYYYKQNGQIKNGLERETANGTPKGLKGIVVSVNQYSKYKFLIGEIGKIERVTTSQNIDSMSINEFTEIHEFEETILGETIIDKTDTNPYSEANIATLCGETTQSITTKLADTTYRENLFDSTNFYNKVVEAGQSSNIISVLNSNSTYKEELSTKLEYSWNEKLNTICYWLGENCSLYNNGNECTGITGGWNATGYVEECNIGWGKSIAPTITKNTNYFQASISTDGIPYGTGEIANSGYIFPVNSINYNNYSKICIEYNNATMNHYSGSSIICFIKGQNNNYDETTNGLYLCYNNAISGNTNRIVEWEQKSISGDNIIIYLQTSKANEIGDEPTTIDIYNIWLEK